MGAVDAAVLCVAGVGLGKIYLRFAWQVWHLWRWAGSGGVLGQRLGAVDAAAHCVAGVALGEVHHHFAWQAWRLVTSAFVSRGRRSTYGTGLAVVARLGVAWARLVARWFCMRVFKEICDISMKNTYIHIHIHVN